MSALTIGALFYAQGGLLEWKRYSRQRHAYGANGPLNKPMTRRTRTAMSDGGWSLTEVWSDKYQRAIWYLKRDESSRRLFCNTDELDALADLIRTSRGGHTNESEASE